jgi:hypothetical protein
VYFTVYPLLQLIYLNNSQNSGTHLLYLFSIKSITKYIDEEMHRLRYGRKKVELPCPLWMHHPPGISICSFISELCLGFFWRLHFIGIIETWITMLKCDWKMRNDLC